jgi:1-phosphatidylinositol-4-phosphate 5-kinase
MEMSGYGMAVVSSPTDAVSLDCFSVLTLAWHRLYLRGVPKTYNIRLRVLNYISLYVPCYCPSVSDAWGRLYGSLVLTVFASFCLDSFTGAYVFYWLLLLLLYMSAYFLATKSESNNSSDYSAGAQVVRQLVTFLIASKGYLDYVIWFAVNNIEKYVSPRAVGGSPVQGEG